MESNVRFSRIKNKLQIQSSKFLNIKNLLKVVVPIILGLVIICLISIYSIQTSYASRVIKKEEDIPEELYNLTIVLKISDLNQGSGFWDDALQKGLDLYNSRKVKDIFIFIVNDDNQVNFDINKINKYFKTLPESRYKVANLADSVYDVCTSLKSDFKVNKALLITYKTYNARIGFLCNSENVFTAGLEVKSEYKDSFAAINEIIADIIYVVFPTQ
ncbi:MAG: hypothetical protein ABIM99_01730 [Candidatus Dojkabacteria bacterium]